jgi:hypothetical protein
VACHTVRALAEAYLLATERELPNWEQEIPLMVNLIFSRRHLSSRVKNRLGSECHNLNDACWETSVLFLLPLARPLIPYIPRHNSLGTRIPKEKLIAKIDKSLFTISEKSTNVIAVQVSSWCRSV